MGSHGGAKNLVACRRGTALPPVAQPSRMGVIDFVAANPVLVGLTALMLVFVFAVYLFLRRTLLSFREGLDRGRR